MVTHSPGNIETERLATMGGSWEAQKGREGGGKEGRRLIRKQKRERRWGRKKRRGRKKIEMETAHWGRVKYTYEC